MRFLTIECFYFCTIKFVIRVLFVSVAREKSKTSTISAASSASFNQTLEAHSGQVQIIAWNEVHQKLTSTDDNGLVIVWTLHKVKSKSYVDFVNNR